MRLNSKFLIFFILFFSASSAMSVEREKLSFGIFPYIGVNHIVNTYAPLKAFIEESLNVEVVIVSAKSFRKFVSRTSGSKYDFIFTAPHFALKAERELTYERLARFSGDIDAQIVVSKESSISNISDLDGKIVYSPDPLAIISILGESTLAAEGLRSDRSVVMISKLSHRNVLLSVVKEKGVAGLVSSNVLRRFMSKRPELRVVGSSQKIPSAMFMMNVKLSDEIKSNLRDMMEGFSSSAQGKQFFRSMPFNGLQKISDEDMRVLSVYEDKLEQMLN